MKSSITDEPIVTIDDCISLADELAIRLNKLSEYRHPLDIRRGVRKEVVNVNDAGQGIQIRAGSRTYFLDVVTTKEDKRYLKISESRFMGEGKERERSTILVFPENAQEFSQAIMQLVAKLS